MKDQEFVALLNLFIDREISAEDAVRLEAEVRRDPARRALYTQYCRMHRACVAHAEAQAAHAEALADMRTKLDALIDAKTAPKKR